MTADDTVTHAADQKSVVSIILDAISTAKIPDGDLSRLAVKRMEGRTVIANCFNFCPLEIASIFDRARSDHGAGFYEVWVLSEKKQIVRRISFNVDEAHKSNAHNNNQNNHSNNDVIGRLENKINQLSSKLNGSHNQSQRQQSTDPLAIIKMMQETSDRAYDRAMKEVSSRLSASATGGDFFENAEKFGRVAEIMGFVRPGEAERDDSDPFGIAKVADTLKPEFGSLIEVLRARTQGQPAGQQGQPAGQPAGQQGQPAGQQGQPAGQQGQPAGQQGQPAGQQAEETAEEIFRRMEAHMLELTAAASRGADPVLYADLTIDRFGDDIVSEWVEMPGLIDQISLQMPTVVPYIPWFKLVFDAARATLDDGEQEDADMGADADTTGNEKPEL